MSSSSLSSTSKRKEPSETEKKRKEHAARILQEKRAERTQMTQDKEFLCVQKFQNHLPKVPSGPYFKTILLPHSSLDYAGYVVSTLEKNYVWQPHHDRDAGLRMQLVDSESVLATSDRSVSAADTKYLAERRSSGRSGVVDVDRIPWLKRTTYSTNDLYDNVNKFKGVEELHKGYKERKIRGIGENRDPFDMGYVMYSFGVEAQKASEKAAKRSSSALFSVPILPDSRDMWSQNISLVSFGEGALPEDDPVENSSVSAGQSTSSNKRQRLSRCIIANIRDVAVKNSSLAESAAAQQVFAASLTVPVESGDDTAEGEYQWERDLRLDIKNKKLDDCFELSVRESEGACTYCPVRSRIEMKKLDVKFSQPQR